jgi:acyl-CoA dehydrogenase
VHGSLRVLDILARDTGRPADQTLEGVWQRYQRERSSGASPFAAAVLAAFAADRLGFAFAAGYPAALEHLVGGQCLPAALCVTEIGGNGPRAIETQLEARGSGYRLTGAKTFVTFGRLATHLIVAARAGDKPDGKPDLKVVQIPAARDGVAVEDLPEIAFVPEIPHARVSFEQAEVREEELLPGDGYLGYVKPFRTIEDIHVVGATLGYLVGAARRNEASSLLIAKMTEKLLSLEHLLEGDPLDPRVHVALHGAHTGVMELLTTEDFTHLLECLPDDERSRWERDKPLLAVASSAREKRFERARQALP